MSVARQKQFGSVSVDTDMPTTYLSGKRTAALDRIASHHMQDLGVNWIGLIVTPLTKEYLRTSIVRNYPSIGIDNGCFSESGRRRYTWPEYERIIKLAKFQGEHLPGGVLFATARDMPFNWEETLRLSVPVLPKIKALGVPAAIVLQNGARPDNVPWDLCDVIFLGGGPLADNQNQEWKTSTHAQACVQEAKRRGKSVHMGRVNSHARLSVASEWGVTSADGTYILAEMNKRRLDAYRKAAAGNAQASQFISFGERQLDAEMESRRPMIASYVSRSNRRLSGQALDRAVDAQVERERLQRRDEVYERAAKAYPWKVAPEWLKKAEAQLEDDVSWHVIDWAHKIAGRERRTTAKELSNMGGPPLDGQALRALDQAGYLPKGGNEYPEDDPIADMLST